MANPKADSQSSKEPESSGTGIGCTGKAIAINGGVANSGIMGNSVSIDRIEHVDLLQVDRVDSFRLPSGPQYATATAEDLTMYLRQRIQDWDSSPWLGSRRPSQLERNLRTVTRGQEPELLKVSAALARFEHIVLLGGPGSGKTWLGRRIAREAAQKALLKLESGAESREVEIPLFTTWGRWVGTPGDPVNSLVESSFVAGLGHADLGAPDLVARVKRFIVATNQAIVIVDSLDEAANMDYPANRIHELESIRQWRTVVTSRHGAWDGNKPQQRDAQTGVMELQPLDWYDDIQPFIESWFDQDHYRARSLISRLSDDVRLRSSASEPLLLTFYCMYTQDHPLTEPLPTTRRELYSHVIDRLLSGEWTGEGHSTRRRKAKTLLTEWAWEAVKDANSPISGLGDWSDAFEPVTDPDQNIERIIDHVAPGEVSNGHDLRRFRHRTLQEHFVAEAVSSMTVVDAAQILLPHLWFDRDWQIAGPAAIAAHPKRSALLKELLLRARGTGHSSLVVEANDELDQLLLRVAADSNEEDWSLEHQELIAGLRGTYISTRPELVLASNHWVGSNPGVLQKMLKAMADAVTRKASCGLTAHKDSVARDPADPATTGKTSHLTDEQRLQALSRALKDLATAKSLDVPDRVTTVVSLQPTDKQRQQALIVVLKALDNAQPWEVPGLVVSAESLQPTDKQRQQTLTIILKALDIAEPWDIPGLTKAIDTLNLSDSQCLEALMALAPVGQRRLAGLKKTNYGHREVVNGGARATRTTVSFAEWTGRIRGG